ncbi:hypothetical protein Hanom_Chr13g01227561 [Helianthus anomalus]
MKKQALICFNEVIQEDDRWLKIAMEVEGFVHVLVGFLSSKDLGVQENGWRREWVGGWGGCRIW